MHKEEIEEHLSKCDSLVELIMEANKLKQSGEKEVTVNNVVTKLRKSMIRTGSKVRRLSSISVSFETKQPIGYIPFKVEQLNRPIIAHDGNTVLL